MSATDTRLFRCPHCRFLYRGECRPEFCPDCHGDFSDLPDPDDVGPFSPPGSIKRDQFFGGLDPDDDDGIDTSQKDEA